MDRLQWCLLFLCLVSLSCGNCPIGPGCGPCSPSIDWIQLECRAIDESSGFDVAFRPNEKLQIDCYNSPDWSEFRLGTIQQIQRVKTIQVTSCQLPESEQLGIIIRQLSIKNLEELEFSSSDMDVALNVSRNTLRDFKGIKHLTFVNNNLANVPSDFLHDLSDLTVLVLRTNAIERLPDNFLIMPNLRSVELGDNNIRVIGPNAFGELEHLQLLNIWNNKLTEIMPNTFDKLTSLTSIDLHGNQLESLPDDIFATLPNLEVLNMSQNNFTLDFLSRAPFRNNRKLRILKFNGNKRHLKTLPNKFLANMINLKNVTLSGNGLITLPEDLFFGSINLLDLNMERNSITSLPTDFFRDCINLENVNFGSNRITALPSGIFSKLKNLQTLNLSKNNIAIISDIILDGLSSLQTLDMEKNNLRIINGPLRLENLRVAKFSYNNLTLQDQSRLTSPFSLCGRIRHLYLSYNNISYIFNDWIGSTHLQTLNLQHNKLRRITDRDLGFMSDDLRVDLSYNEIEEISLRTAEDVALIPQDAKNIFVNVDHNPLKCDCKVYDLLRNVEKKMHPFVYDLFRLDVGFLKCQEPSFLKDTLITSLKSETFECSVNEPQTMNATCPDECNCWLRPHNRAYIIDCSNKSLDRAPVRIRAPKGHLIELNLTGNHLTSMPSMSQSGYDKVTVLSLAHNNIDDIPLQSLSTNLQKLELHNNELSKIDILSLNYLRNCTNLTQLTLHENLWECNCDLREFSNFIQAMRMRIPSLHSVTCGGEKRKIFEMTPEELCPVVIGWIIASCIGIALLGIIIGGLAALYYRYQQEIKIWLYARRWCLWLVTEDELDKDRIYDAFISYSHKDDDFVVNQLVPRLEGGPRPFKLCVHYRDWPVGEWIPKQVIRSVEDSKRTVVVLSSNFLESEWGKMEFRAAHRQALSEGRARVIVIIYGEIPPIDHLDSELQAYLTMNTYVKWGDPWFWDKLRYALPHRSEVQEKKWNTKSAPQRLPPKVVMEETE